MGYPSTDSANASSSNKELQRKELMQCQYCFRSRLSGGAILSRCSGCQIAWYCYLREKSRDCQTKHWPYHKKLCKVNRHILSMPPAHAERMKQLRAFTTKHRPTLVQLGRLALDLHRHPENWVKKVLLVVVRPRSNIESRKAEKAFEVLDLLVKDPSYWGDNEESIHVQFRYMQDLQARVGGFGGYTVVIQDQDTTLQNIVGVGFTEDLTDEDFTEYTWKEAMLHRMNNGIVL